ncbi:hypothetical protein ACOSQ2_014209 [Xanthoceras sorbifolium]
MVDSISSCPAGFITAGSNAEPPSGISRFGSLAVDPSLKIRCRALEVSVAGVACPGADVGLALISYRTCPNRVVVRAWTSLEFSFIWATSNES